MTCINPEGYYLTHYGWYEVLDETDTQVQVVNDARKLSWYPKNIFIN